MSYFVCQNCGKAFIEDSDFFQCSCKSIFCSDACGGRLIVEDNGIDDEDITNCVLCRQEIIPDHKLLSFICEKINLTHDEACGWYRNERSK